MIFKRKRKKLTDYRARLGLIKSKKHRIVVRRSLNNIRIQFVKFSPSGDLTETEVLSRKIKDYGWPFHCGSTPAAYLCGFLAGKIALKAGIKEAIVDIGIQRSVRGSSLYAGVLGAKQAGINIPVNEKIIPANHRINGKHIAEYAKLLKNNQKKYNKQFSSYIKKNINPEEIPEIFEKTKKKIEEVNIW